MSKIVLANYCMRTMCGAIDNHALAVGGMFKEIWLLRRPRDVSMKTSTFYISHDRDGGEDDVSWGGGDRMMTEWRTYSVKNKKWIQTLTRVLSS